MISVAFKTPLKNKWESAFIKIHFCIDPMTVLVSRQAVPPHFTTNCVHGTSYAFPNFMHSQEANSCTPIIPTNCIQNILMTILFQSVQFILTNLIQSVPFILTPQALLTTCFNLELTHFQINISLHLFVQKCGLQYYIKYSIAITFKRP